MRFALALLLVCQTFAVHADVFRPAYLELREAGLGRYDVLWKVPAQGQDMRLAANVRFPGDAVALTEPKRVFSSFLLRVAAM